MSLWLIFTSIVLFGWISGWVYREHPYVGFGLFALLGTNSVGSMFYGMESFQLIQTVLLVVATLTWMVMDIVIDGPY